MSVERYNARTAEIHWQQAWDAQNAFAPRDDAPQPRRDLPATASRPSGRLRMGHVRRYIIADAVARYRRANGFHVRAPVPDAGGGTLLKSLGLSLDWQWSCETTVWNPEAGTAWEDSAAAVTVVETEPAESSGIDPEDLVDAYGADATRWFVLSNSPPDRDIVFTETGIRGAWRFVQRLWHLINDAAKFSRGAPATRPAAFSAPAIDMRKIAHQVLAHVSADIERARFNVGVARIHGYARALKAVSNSPEPASPDLKFAAREAAEIMVQIFHPMMPHLAEACWASLGHASLLATQCWPAVEAVLLMESAVTLPVHVNGKKRADVTVARDARNGDIEASVLALDVVRRALDGKAPRRLIIVPQRIINVVA